MAPPPAAPSPSRPILAAPLPSSQAPHPHPPTLPRRPTLPGLSKVGAALRKPSHSSSTPPAPPSPKPSSSYIGRGTPARAAPKQALPSRTSKVTQKHVFLPEELQTRPIPESARPLVTVEEEGPPRDERPGRSEPERMSKEEREEAGYARLTAYAVGESYRMKLLAAFSKREHGAWTRQFDEAIYVVYHLPLLPGYSAATSVRSSPPVKSPGGGSILDVLEESEDLPYQGSYFAPPASPPRGGDASVVGSPPRMDPDGFLPGSPTENERPTVEDEPPRKQPKPTRRKKARQWSASSDPSARIAEAIHFDYGVSVFFNFTANQEAMILSDLQRAGAVVRPLGDDEREVEECHYAYDSSAHASKIFNDFFTFKTNSHLLKLSLAHALAQSTKLSVFEERTQSVLSSASTIPKELAATGKLALDRRAALKLTGRLFQLRVDVNLVSNVLDVPELFWSEASLKALYDAGREYFEVGPRVHVLNEKLQVAGDLLDIIHEHVNEQGMSRITIIIIWLIVVACLVAVGEVAARLTFHAIQGPSGPTLTLFQRLGRRSIDY